DDPQTVPLEGELLDLINRQWEAREYKTPAGAIGVSTFVFHRDGHAVPQSTLNHQFTKAAKKAGLVARIFHDLRRTRGPKMVRRRGPESVAMRVAGHRSDTMFRRYDITSLDDKAEALRRASEYAKTRVAIGQNVAVGDFGHTDGHTDPKTSKLPRKNGA